MPGKVLQKAIFFILGLIILLPEQSFAQDIEPRRWTTLPLGINSIGIGYGYTDGKLFFDPLLNVEDAKVRLNTFVFSYIRSFKIANKLVRLDVIQPLSNARWEGLLSNQPTEITRTGFADPRVRLSLHLMGPPAAGPAELNAYLIAHPVNTTVGFSIAFTLPFGQYFPDKLLNLGQHQFVIRPQVGILHNQGNWSYEMTGSVFLFSRNKEFFGNATREQDPQFTLQSHLIRGFKAGIWTSFSAAYGFGGQSTVNDQAKKDKRENFLVSFSTGFRLTRSQSIKFSYIYTETLKDIGADTHTLLFAWAISFK